MKKLEVKNLSKSFKQGDMEYPILQDINFHAEKGEILCLLGSSGCGKTTLLRLVGGFEAPDSGEILLMSNRVTKPGKDRIMVFQDFQQLFPWKTVIENLVLPLTIHGIGKNKETRIEIAKEYLRMVQLNGYEEFYPYQLSGGMKQRAAIARSLALNPQILLMDEPFANIDAQTRSSMQLLLLEIWKKTGITILFVTHDIQEAIILSDRILVLKQHDKKTDGGIKMIENKLPRPRIAGDPGFSKMWTQIYNLF